MGTQPEIPSRWIDQAVQAAFAARAQAYAPYSRFLVGAALLDENGQVAVGCNLENASYSLTLCAERGAVQQAWFTLQKPWRLLVVASEGGVTPCGACRQVLAEFAPRLPVLLVDSEQPDARVWTSVDQLLPARFELSRQASSPQSPSGDSSSNVTDGSIEP